MRKIYSIFIVVLTMCLLSSGQIAAAKTVRVAFLPDMFGFYKIEENGTYSGYNYDYLMNLAQHTDWEYEFVLIEEGLVSTSLVKAEEMLAAGEIDLLGPFSATSSRFSEFESGERNYGVYRYNLYSARNKYAITCDNYFLQETLRVALVEPYADLNTTFLQIMEEYGMNLDITYVDSHTETHELLFAEEVDTLLNLDMSSNAENLDYLTTIQRIPFHFVSTKGNTELIAELDEGIRKLEIVEPEIHQILLEKYFGKRYDEDFLFTEAEEISLSKVESFKVGMLKNEPPYQYFDENGANTGISVDILKKFEEIIGIPFEIVWKDSHDDLALAMEKQEIDIISTVPNDYPLASSLSVILTNPYLSSSAYWVRSINEVENPEIFFHFVSSNIPFYEEDEMSTTLDIEADFKTINEEGSISVFCDPYVAEYYLGLNQYENIEVKTVTDVLSEMSFGVGSHIDVDLIGMINRAILYLDAYEVDEIIFKHTSVQPEYTFWDMLQLHAYKINTFLLCCAALIVFSMFKTSQKFRDLSRRDSLTKLFNAGYFHEYAEQHVPKLATGTLFLIDIDYFKEVNDTYGHHSGDDVIKEVAHNLRKFAPEGSLQARLGGDEFAVFVEGPVEKEKLEESCQLFLSSMVDNETKIPVTLSIGAFSFQSPLEYKTLYKKADKSLYKVKEKGRNGFLIE